MFRLPSVLTDHAVLQQSREVALWGWTEPGKRVTALFRGSSASAVAGKNGRFDLKLASGTAGGPFDLVFQVDGEAHVVHDVLVGEVWLCSGQSNMEWPLRDALGAADEIPQARHARIRLLQIPRTTATAPADDVPAQWAYCTPDNAAPFSAIGFFFGKHLHQQLDVPIGLISSNWGGTTAEAWTNKETLLAYPDLAYLADPALAVGPHVDAGIAEHAATWMRPDLHTADWGTMTLPTAWEWTGLNIDGAVWFRREVEIPAAWAGRPLVLSLGIADDFDQAFFDGHFVGSTGLECPEPWSTRRRYPISAELATAGRHVIAVRVFDQWGDGGLLGPADQMYLAPADDESNRIDLRGAWQFKVELALPPRSPMGAPSTTLYNGMIHPLIPHTIAGVIWYQGESNGSRAFEYRTLFPALIQSWRKAWKDDFAFLFVLLAGWHAHPTEPSEGQFAEVRDAQLSALALPRTAAASAVDLGDIEDVHPRNKKDVGLRLAKAALAICHGRQLEFSGPVFEAIELCGEQATLRFTHAQGMHARGDSVEGFAVAGADGQYFWASARIEENNVILSCPHVADIRTVRYAWADHPIANVYNAAGLPMMPFRTDDLAYTTAPVEEEYGRLG